MPAKPLKPEEIYMQTPDKWRLVAYHYPKKTARFDPVILLHGLGSNHYNMDFPDPRFSLAQYLYKQGFDVWVLEFRGAGKSQPISAIQRLRAKIRPAWTFDDHVFRDIPAFVKGIQKVTGKKSFHWVGHSLGGSIVYAVVQTLGNQICRSAVTIGSAMNSQAKPGFARILIKIEDRILKWVPLIPGKYLSRLSYPAFGAMAPLLDNFYYCLDNMEKKALRLVGKVVVENISIPLFLQMHRWYQENHFSTLDRQFSYHKNLQAITAPWLVLAGSVDGLTPLPDVYYGYDNVNSTDKKFIVFGKEFGYKTDYGHLDLVLGKNAPEEVYPVILDWLYQHDNKPHRKAKVAK